MANKLELNPMSQANECANKLKPRGNGKALKRNHCDTNRDHRAKNDLAITRV